MMKKIKRALVAMLLAPLCSPSFGQTAAISDSLPASRLVAVGRFRLDRLRGLEMIGSAVHFGVSFTGDSCALYATLPETGSHNYLQYELDGVYGKKIRLNGNDQRPIIVTVSGAGIHVLWIYKATEAQTGPLFIAGVKARGIAALAEPNVPMIEFIGNSITCGAAADTSGYPCSVGEYHDHHNAYMAYGPRVARALGLRYLLTSISGYGIYRTWNQEGPSLPQVYENTALQPGDTAKWNFATYSPKIVSIALGTNDISPGDGKTPRAPFDSARFVRNFVRFVEVVKSKYPMAQIALLTSPMVRDSAGTVLSGCLKAVKSSIDGIYPSAKPVALFFFRPMQPHGCSGHPSVHDHEVLAEELKPFFKSLL